MNSSYQRRKGVAFQRWIRISDFWGGFLHHHHYHFTYTNHDYDYHNNCDYSLCNHYDYNHHDHCDYDHHSPHHNHKLFQNSPHLDKANCPERIHKQRSACIQNMPIVIIMIVMMMMMMIVMMMIWMITWLKTFTGDLIFQLHIFHIFRSSHNSIANNPKLHFG